MNTVVKSNKHKKLVIPQALEVEASVLGRLLVEAKSAYHAFELLKAESFFSPSHQRIFNAMCDLFHASQHIDSISVTLALKRLGTYQKGDESLLMELSAGAISNGNLEYHARVLLEKQILRQVIELAKFSAFAAQDEMNDCFDVLGQMQTGLIKILQVTARKNSVHVGEGIDEAVTRIGKLRSGEIVDTGIATGFTRLDEVFGGLEGGSLVLIAGRPSSGKTALGLSIARRIADTAQTDFFSLEMPLRELSLRLLSASTHIGYLDLKLGTYPGALEEDIVAARARLRVVRLHIDDSAGMSLVELKSKIQRSVMERGTRIVFVDYLQLMKLPGKDNKNNELGDITQTLKGIAKEFNIVIVALSQLNRYSEMRKDHRPSISDLRDSGCLESDADIVILVYRPEMYDIQNFTDGSSTNGVAEVIVAKNRNGATATCRMAFLKETMKFENLSSEAVPI